MLRGGEGEKRMKKVPGNREMSKLGKDMKKLRRYLAKEK